MNQLSFSYQPGKSIEYVQKTFGIENVIKLASNENPLGPSPSVYQAILEKLPAISQYPDPTGSSLKTALADRLGVSHPQITLGNGSDEIIHLVTRMFVQPQQSILVSEYAFAAFSIAARIVGADLIQVPAKEWGHDLEAFINAITPSTRLIFLANPNNPTGTWYTRDQFEAFMRQVPKDIMVVVDEAYFEYVETTDYPNALQWLPKYVNLVVTRTFSKIYGLAGLRIGFAVSHPEVADRLNRIRHPFNVSSIALIGAEAALRDIDHLTKTKAVTKAGMSQFTEAFQKMRLSYLPSVANFVTVDLQEETEFAYQKMLEMGVIIRPLKPYGLLTHCRISIGLEDQNVRCIEALSHVLSHKHRESSDVQFN